MKNTSFLVSEEGSIVNETKELFLYLYQKYVNVGISSVDNKFFEVIETKDMTDEQYAEFNRVLEEVQWLEDNLSIKIKSDNLSIVDNR